ncbi:DUF6906 family protein [Gracilibacillus salinarum]|uniref:DUF6906 domain-containing protein n=1 Tax=Gracilibacillus salinarum TaxID=2932255 RepID=A0ABY4GNW2_9BACI|nr:hypothetical protein [Gracilibacillus salinarum]UOQ85670.1 hypothetical protein MUN87_01825 [Gracilibacillus salinarum]
MKHGRRPTRKHKEVLVAENLNPKNWLIVKNLDDRLEVVHKETGNIKIIDL